jgi:UDP-N-acetylglucosamine 4,6-dehydratase
VVRYGNVIGSRGSVIPFFKERAKLGKLPITDPRMTRFWIKLEDGASLVDRCLQVMRGGEIFIPKIPSMRITESASAIDPDCEQETIGIRPGEKLHELLITRDDARHTLEFKDLYDDSARHSHVGLCRLGCLRQRTRTSGASRFRIRQQQQHAMVGLLSS